MRHVTISLANHAPKAASVDFVVIGKRVNNLPVDLVIQDGSILRIQSGTTGINFEGRFRESADEILGAIEQGPIESPLTLHRSH